jgi:putative ABC transport system permease protein
MAARALRVWRGAPGVAVAVVLLLGLGLSGVTALYGPTYSLAVTPLPFPSPDRLVRIGGDIPVFNSYANAIDVRDRFAPLFESLAAYAPATVGGTEVRFAKAERPRPINALAVTTEYFDTIGIPPAFGAGFAREQKNSVAVVISDRLWRQEFGGSTSVLGTTIWIREQAHTVFGVMPKDLKFPGDVDLWLLMGSGPYAAHVVEVIGRLRADLSIQQAASALKGLGIVRVPGPSGQISAGGPILQPWQSFLYRDTRDTIRTLWVVCVLFLFATCVGAANLLLSNGVRRRQEMAIRLALGSSRWRLFTQLLAETALLTSVAALVGIGLSSAVATWLQTQVPVLQGSRPLLPTTLLSAVIVVFLVTAACGLVPAFFATRVELNAALLAGATGPRSPVLRRRLTLLDVLVSVQLSIALALLIASILLFRSLVAISDSPFGFTPRGVVVFQSKLPASSALAAAVERARIEQDKAVAGSGLNRTALQKTMNDILMAPRGSDAIRNNLFVREMYDRVGALPAVHSVGVMIPPPFTAAAAVGGRMLTFISANGPSVRSHVMATRGWASATAFDVLGISFVAGRGFTSTEVAEALAAGPPMSGLASSNRPGGVVIINEALARRLWDDPQAVGKRLKDPYDRSRTYTIVGVVADARWTADGTSDVPAIYYPFTGSDGFILFVAKLRDGTSLETFAADVDTIQRALMPGVSRPVVQSLENLTEGAARRLRVFLGLLGSFALIACVVAGLGVHAAAALMAAARRRETGIRMALGADAKQIRNWILVRNTRPVIVGTTLGLALGWALSRELSHLLPNLTEMNAGAYVMASTFLVVIAMTSGLFPALRAASVDPAAVLRSQ